MEILAPTDENLDRAARLLREGQVVAMPTETVYGLAACAFDAQAVTRIFAVKERPLFDPLIVHVTPPPAGALAHLEALGLVDGAQLGPAARARIETLASLWPGPLTVVLPRRPAVPDLVTSGLPTVAVRVPRQPVAQALLARVGTPLAAPSANRFGRISPTSAADVAAELGARVPLILDGGPCEVGIESTVVHVAADGALTLLRPGGVAREQLEQLTGAPVGLQPIADAASPGRLPSHYAPRKRLHLLPGSLDTVEAAPLGGGRGPIGLLLQAGDARAAAARLEALTGRAVIVRVLSPGGDLAEAARNLFASLRALDESTAEELLAEPCASDAGLGHAITDRLRRAAT